MTPSVPTERSSSLILFNGASGGIGRYMRPSIDDAGRRSAVLASRLEDRAGLARELGQLSGVTEATFIHLAAMVSVPACEADPVRAKSVNVTEAAATAKQVIGWARSEGVDLRVVLVSTGHVYEAPAVGSRVGEDHSIAPRSVYARTKREAELEFERACAEVNVPLVIARVFGLIGPAQPDHYVLPGLFRRIQSRDVGGIPGLSYTRDYLDARDVCRALVDLTRTPWTEAHRAVNVCSGVATRIIDILRAVAESLMSAVEAELLLATATEGPSRQDDVTWLVGDPSRFSEMTGRSAFEIPLAETVLDARQHQQVQP